MMLKAHEQILWLKINAGRIRVVSLFLAVVRRCWLTSEPRFRIWPCLWNVTVTE